MIGSISPTVTNTSDLGAETSLKETMGKDDFLKLLVAQMQAQDPLDPMDNTDFSAQLAQFSALEQMQNVNTNLETMMGFQASINNNMAINLIDKVVSAPGNNLVISGGKPDPISYELGANADSVTITVLDSANVKVASMLRGAESVGSHNVVWDGKDRSGNILQDGNYRFNVVAKDSSGFPIVTRTHQKSVVTGVAFEDGVSYALSGESKINVKDITTINSSL